MKILAIETSSRACSAALSVDGLVTEKHEILDNQHTKYLLKFIDELISDSGTTKSDLTAIAVGNGPGSFTGLRLGMGVAQGLAYGLGVPLIPVSSLLNIAAQSDQQYSLVAVDARMGEVYWQCFNRIEESRFEQMTDAALNKPDELTLPGINGSWFGIGSGWDQYVDYLKFHLSEQSNWSKGILPRASLVAALAKTSLEDKQIDFQQQALPRYVRNKVTN